MRPVPLTPEDEAILRLESPTVVGHTCKVVRLAGDAPSLEALRAMVAARVEATPGLTRRLEKTSTGLAWVAADGFDVAAHVVPAPGAATGHTGLEGVVARLFAEHLDRSRPLWRLDVVRVPGGDDALVWRVHHALADGTTMMRYARSLLWDPQRAPEAGTARVPHAVDDARRRSHLAGFLRREFARTRKGSPLDGQIGTRREIAFASAPLDDLHRAAKGLCGATLNDAVLTAVAGGLRRWIIERHGHLGVIRVKVPVSLHHEGLDAGNRDSFFTVGVPLDEPDPVRRLRETHAATLERKEHGDAETMDSLLRHLSGVSPALGRLCARIERSPRSFTVNVSNVPGPRSPVGVLRTPVAGLYSIAEVAEHHALRVAVVSMGATLFFGLCADPAIVDDVRTLAAGVEAECGALVARG